MTRTSIVLLLVCGGIAARLDSQTPASQVVASIAGTVVDGQTGEPIASAAVFLRPLHKAEGSCGVSNFGDGKFLCEVFAPGEFQLSATHRGYSPGDFGMRTSTDVPQPFDLAAGEHATAVTLRLWKNGTITGRALDAAGEPIVNASVSAIWMYQSGPARFMRSPTTTTDDRGIYRLAEMSPGDYVIALTRGRSLSAPSMAIFHPQAASFADAKTVHVTSGTDLTGIDVSETRTRTFTVSGQLLGRSTARSTGYEARPTSVRLIPADAPQTPPGFDVAVADAFAQVGGNGARDRGGAFTLTNVPPGHYVIRVVAFPNLGGSNVVSSSGIAIGSPRAPVPLVDTLWAEMPVTVTDHDVLDLPVTLQRAARLSGRMDFEDAPGKQVLEDAPVFLVRTDSRQYGDMPFGVTEADGTFRTVGVPPGPYALLALPPLGPAFSATGWRMASVLVNGRDVADHAFDVGTTDIADVLVTLRRLASLSGFVRDASGAARGDTSLYIFTADRTRWDPQGLPPTTTPREFRPNQRGHYHSELLPGDYYVAAGTDALADWLTPEKLAELAKTATKISVAPGEQKTLDVVIR
ncbi:MAG TPA: carboxypeptidase regulatory-like domain-containing protein [Vicinamibacterales bacterium]|nr:carboxypeptidase regulatory-like domain-containing protein [Vicinamibacterales bacterium]